MIHFTKRIAIAILSLLSITALPAWALKNIIMPDSLQTSHTHPIARKLYLKLPLAQVATDWIFNKKDDVLAGTLMLAIQRANQREEIVIFSNGQLSSDWRLMPSSEPIFPTSIYFGFISNEDYLTAPGDTLELIWHVPEPLSGIGADFTAILPAGTYRAVGNYSGLTDALDITQTRLYQRARQSILESTVSDSKKEELLTILTQELKNLYQHTAFLHNWHTQWDMQITSNAGWERIGNIGY